MGNGQTRELNLSNGSLSTIPEEVYYLRSLEKLYLRRNLLSSLDPYLFEALRKLKEISLRENRLSDLPDSFYRQLCLSKLSIAVNRFATLPPDIGMLEGLEMFTAARNMLTGVPAEFANLQRLRAVDLQQNRLDRIPEPILHLSSLTVLTLQHNAIAYIPPHIALLKALEHLNLSFNQLQMIPEEVSDLRNLAELNLSGNSITRIPVSLCLKGNSLMNLDLHTNQIETVPPEIGQLLTLKRLNLAINLIKSLPESICSLIHLEWLNLNDNKLKQLPVDIGKLSKLHKMGVVQNQLTSIPRSLGNCKYLTKLDVHSNLIPSFPLSLSSISTLTNFIFGDNPLVKEFGVYRVGRCIGSTSSIGELGELERFKYETTRPSLVPSLREICMRTILQQGLFDSSGHPIRGMDIDKIYSRNLVPVSRISGNSANSLQRTFVRTWMAEFPREQSSRGPQRSSKRFSLPPISNPAGGRRTSLGKKKVEQAFFIPMQGFTDRQIVDVLPQRLLKHMIDSYPHQCCEHPSCKNGYIDFHLDVTLPTTMANGGPHPATMKACSWNCALSVLQLTP